MGQKVDDRDYEEYKVKVPKRDKEGNDITSDKLGKGGRHRDDGTFSGMAYDFQPLEGFNDEKTREDLENEIEMLAYEERMPETQEERSALDTINDVFNTINSILELLAEHPEIIERAINVGKKVKHDVIKGKDKVASFIFKEKGRLQGVDTDNHRVKTTKAVKSMDNNIKECFDDVSIASNSQKKVNMSIAEARELIIGILSDYISMKKSYISMREKMDRLSNANVDNTAISKLDVNQVIAKMELLIKNYPALMDDSTSKSVLTLLKLNTDEIENRKIKEVLQINISSSIENDFKEYL